MRDREGGFKSRLWDMSIPLKLFIEGFSNGSLFSETSASRSTLIWCFSESKKKWQTAWRYSLLMKASIKMKENGIFASTTHAVRHYHWNFLMTVNLRSRLHAALMSRETDLRFCLTLKITLEKSTCPGQRPQCPSLSLIFSWSKSMFIELHALPS